MWGVVRVNSSCGRGRIYLRLLLASSIRKYSFSYVPTYCKNSSYPSTFGWVRWRVPRGLRRASHRSSIHWRLPLPGSYGLVRGRRWGRTCLGKQELLSWKISWMMCRWSGTISVWTRTNKHRTMVGTLILDYNDRRRVEPSIWTTRFKHKYRLKCKQK